MVRENSQGKIRAALLFGGEAQVFKMIYPKICEDFDIETSYTVSGQPAIDFMKSEKVKIPVMIITPEEVLNGKVMNAMPPYLLLSGINIDFGNNLRKKFPGIRMYNIDARWSYLHR